MYFSRLHGAAKSKPIHSTHLGSQNKKKCVVNILEIKGGLKSSVRMIGHPKLPSPPGTQQGGGATYNAASVPATEKSKKIYHLRKIRKSEMQEFLRQAEKKWQWGEARTRAGRRKGFAEREEGVKSSGEEENNKESSKNQSPREGEEGGTLKCPKIQTMRISLALRFLDLVHLSLNTYQLYIIFKHLQKH